MSKQENNKIKKQNIYKQFKNHKTTEGFKLNEIYEVFFPFWFCKQKIVVEKDIELDRFSKIILELVNTGITSHKEICGFLGIKEDDFVTMQFHFLLKNELITEETKNNEITYEITHEGISFLKNKTKIQNMETVEFEYFYNDLSMEMLDIVDYIYLYNDLSKEYFNPDNPIDKNISQNMKKRFSGYQVVQTNRLKQNNNNNLPINHLPFVNKPSLNKIKQSDFALFFNKQKKDMTFYDFESKNIEVHQRSILFLLFEYINNENELEIEIRQFKNSVRDFNGYKLEEKLSVEATNFLKKNDNFINELRNTNKEKP